MSAIINPAGNTNRIQAVDILRGLMMVIMAIDHVRVYSGMPAGGTDPGIFFTRWITHFSAPGFAFLAGASAFLFYQRSRDVKKVSRFLLTRGLLLVFLELTLIRFFWMFNFNYSQFTLAGVIWMLGWCMVILAAFVHLRATTVGITGLVIIAVQQLFHYIPLLLPEPVRGPFGKIGEFIYPSGLQGPEGIAILYVIVPWIGVMMTGYGFGQLLNKDYPSLKKICLRIGLIAIALFIVVGIAVILFGPPYTGNLPFVFRLLAQQKYPPSQLFLLMTLGPLIALIPWAQQAKGSVAGTLAIFGRVPFFFYLLHILLIHLSALLVNFLISGTMHQEWYATAPFVEIPEDQRWGLPLLYLVYVIDIVILYFCCRYYSRYKAAHPEKKWLRYL